MSRIQRTSWAGPTRTRLGQVRSDDAAWAWHGPQGTSESSRRVSARGALNVRYPSSESSAGGGAPGHLTWAAGACALLNRTVGLRRSPVPSRSHCHWIGARMGREEWCGPTRVGAGRWTQWRAGPGGMETELWSYAKVTLLSVTLHLVTTIRSKERKCGAATSWKAKILKHDVDGTASSLDV
jgi:hypothetical protein